MLSFRQVKIGKIGRLSPNTAVGMSFLQACQAFPQGHRSAVSGYNVEACILTCLNTLNC